MRAIRRLTMGQVVAAAGVATRAEVARDAWLSALLGRPAWRVSGDVADVGAAVAQAGRGPGFFFARVPTADVEGLNRFENAGFHIVDVTITLEAAEGEIARAAASNARRAVSTDRARVAQIASTSFEFSRLHLDPMIPRAIADRSRAEWASNFFAGTRGDAMIVAPAEGPVCAFLLAIGPRDGVLTIDLIASDASARRRGLAASCIGLAAGQPGTERLRVGTQAANVGSLRFYENLGFRTVSSHYVLHMHRS